MAMADTTSARPPIAQASMAQVSSLPAVVRSPKLLIRETLAGIVTDAVAAVDVTEG